MSAALAAAAAADGLRPTGAAGGAVVGAVFGEAVVHRMTLSRCGAVAEAPDADALIKRKGHAPLCSAVHEAGRAACLARADVGPRAAGILRSGGPREVHPD